MGRFGPFRAVSACFGTFGQVWGRLGTSGSCRIIPKSLKTIPKSFVRAAVSLGAHPWEAFWKVYFPNTVAGIGAGSILVFILSIGYYITPELVGGNTGTFISNRIAYHISSSLNWGLGAALGVMLLGIVLAFYILYDRIVGIDKMRLG
mgnify:CR=1 FL=1